MARPLQVQFTTPGTYQWTVPAGVTSVCVVCVGGGGSVGNSSIKRSGGGGGLGWKNNIPVIPGDSYTVVVGRGGYGGTTGGQSYFISNAICSGGGGTDERGGGYVGDGGGNGGGSADKTQFVEGGGGAGGYSGNGGNPGSTMGSGTNGKDGRGGGGAGGGLNTCGGGVGIFGEGPSGLGSSGAGAGGSGGQTGNRCNGGDTSYGGGLYGGGGGHCKDNDPYQQGGHGAVRIIWGAGRAFPSTNTEDLFLFSGLEPTDILLLYGGAGQAIKKTSTAPYDRTTQQVDGKITLWWDSNNQPRDFPYGGGDALWYPSNSAGTQQGNVTGNGTTGSGGSNDWLVFVDVITDSPASWPSSGYVSWESDGSPFTGSYKVQLQNLFNYPESYVLLQDGTRSYKCKVSDLSSEASLSRYMLINRGSKSYKVESSSVVDEYSP